MSVLSRFGDALNWSNNVEDPDLPPGERLLRSQGSYHTTHILPDVTGKLFLTNERLVFKRSVERWKVSIPGISTWRTLSLNIRDIERMNPAPFGGGQLLELRMRDGTFHRFLVDKAELWTTEIEGALPADRSERTRLWRTGAGSESTTRVRDQTGEHTDRTALLSRRLLLLLGATLTLVALAIFTDAPRFLLVAAAVGTAFRALVCFGERLLERTDWWRRSV